MARVLLVRHGQSVWNDADRVLGWAPVDLTDRGRAQARAVGAALTADYSVDRVLTSDLRRARETAVRVADAVEVSHSQSVAWRERDWGALQGLPGENLLDRFPELDLLEDDAAADERPLGGESWRDVSERVHDALDDLQASEGTVAVVSHFGPILLALGRARGEPIETALTERRVGTGSVTELRTVDGGWQVERVDWQPAGDAGGGDSPEQ